ncbi:hypothetical protein ES288_A05G316900v1 [Gossypium darwinii]|uniref:Uncharacterized protein n=1 Tax=Gossypium darwinii TaxID=34276 RepID=A0A5D2GLH7_GOSDA|nr:hypothetical protein ES288_A05G316900v1 [Gossypium darwinii]
MIRRETEGTFSKIMKYLNPRTKQSIQPHSGSSQHRSSTKASWASRGTSSTQNQSVDSFRPKAAIECAVVLHPRDGKRQSSKIFDRAFTSQDRHHFSHTHRTSLYYLVSILNLTHQWRGPMGYHN